MSIVNLYRYGREGGGVTVSPVKPAEGVPYDELRRLIADDGMELVRGDVRTTCVDAEIADVPLWHEEPAERPDEEALTDE